MADINLLKPRVKQLCQEFVKKCAEMQLPVIITATYRTVAQQDALYAQGRTAPGQIVTNARGGQSMHNYGVAFDFVPMSDVGQPDWNGDFHTRGKIGEALGLEWGGDWQGFVDNSHLQFTGGYSLSDFQNGRVSDAKFQVVAPVVHAPTPAPVAPQAQPVAPQPTVETLQQEIWIITKLVSLWVQLRAVLGLK